MSKAVSFGGYLALNWYSTGLNRSLSTHAVVESPKFHAPC